MLKIRLTIDNGSADVPSETDWYFQVDPIYPGGNLDMWPSRIDGIITTFPHQNANTEPSLSLEEQPWRNGRLCVDEPDVHLGGERLIGQDTSVSGKMLWHCERARTWLEAARDGRLRKNGDHYEPPHYQTSMASRTVSYCENRSSLRWWQNRLGQYGYIRFATPPMATVFVVDAADVRGGTHHVRWGRAIREASWSDSGCWVAFPHELTSHQYHAPHTWGEFRLAVSRQGLDPKSCLEFVVSLARRRKGGFIVHTGYPIPSIVGGPPVEMRFQTLMFPEVVARKKLSDHAALKWLTRDGPLADGERIDWMMTYNLDEKHLAVRGELHRALVDGRIVVIGCGALGSVVAETLVRMGSKRMLLIDYDTFEPPNVTRHVLTLKEVSADKATALARRLSVASAHVEVSAMYDAYPSEGTVRAVSEADVLIDCSAEDRVLASAPGDARPRWCFSFSLGVDAEELFAYGTNANWFDYAAFRSAFEPFLARTREAYGDSNTRDVGCHNPTFPSPYNRILAHAGTAVEFMNLLVDSGEDCTKVFRLGAAG